MNAILDIQIRVAAREANAALDSIDRQLKNLNRTVASGARAGGGAWLGTMSGHLEKFGKNLQWTGRQLEMSFTLPLVIAGAAATKWAFDNQKAMAGVTKVYGDGTESASQLKAELKELDTTFTLLSNSFGVNKAEVTDIGKAWAEAGSAGAGLQRATKLTLQTMILGGLEAEQATTGLIAVQAEYGASSKQLIRIIEGLNAVENQVPITLKGLIEGFQRAGGAARATGTSWQELAGLLAAMVPAAGSATQAGNSIKSVLSRLSRPTEEMKEAFQELGLSLSDLKRVNGAQQLQKISDALADYTTKNGSANKLTLASAIAGTFQVNRFVTLMDAMRNKNSSYIKARNAAADADRNHAQAIKELNTFLGTDQAHFQQLTQVLKNNLTQAIQPMLPALIVFISKIVSLTTWFANLSPVTQRWIVLGLLLLALIGPLVRYMGAWATLVGLLGRTIATLIPLIFGKGIAVAFDAEMTAAEMVAMEAANGSMLRQVGLLGILRGVWGAFSRVLADIAFVVVPYLINSIDLIAVILADIFSVVVATGAGLIDAAVAIGTGIAAGLGLPLWAVVAIVAAVLIAVAAVLERFYSGGIVGFIKDIAHAFGQLPQIIANVFTAIVRVIAQAMRMIIHWLSYLNPFARHSPSLVDNVTAGVAAILNQYAKLNQIPGMLQGAVNALNAFNKASTPGRAQAKEIDRNKERESVGSFSPNALPQLEAMYRSMDKLDNALIDINNEIANQEDIVRSWEAQLDSANEALDRENEKLDQLRKAATAASEALDAAKDRLNEWENTAIAGSGAMSDAIFANEMAQKSLRLEIMRLEDSIGPIEDVRNQLALLEGSIEKVRGESKDLRAAGAGSDVLGPLQQQIDAMEAQRRALEASGGSGATGNPQLDALNDQLKQLQRRGEELDLERALQFDPLNRQIEQASKNMREMPFDVILNGIRMEQAEVARLQANYDAATQAVKNQEAAVDAATAARDAISKQLDVEKQKLTDLKDAYQAVADQIRDMQSAITDFVSAADKIKEAKDKTSGLGETLAAGMGADIPDVGGGAGIGREGDLLDMKKINAQLEKDMKKAMKDIGDLDMFAPIKDMFRKPWDWIKRNAGNIIKGALIGLALIIGESIAFIPTVIVEVIALGLYLIFGPKVFGAIARGFMSIMSAVWSFLKTIWAPIGAVFGEIFGAIGKVILFVWDNVIQPVLRAIGGFIGGVVVLYFKLLAAEVKLAWGIISTVITFAWGIIKPVLDALWGFINGYLLPIFQLWFAIVQIVVVGIFKLFLLAWDNIGPILSLLFNWIGTILVGAFNFLKTAVETVIRAIAAIAGWFWNTILYPILSAIVGFVTDKLGPIFMWIWHEVLEPAFKGVAAVATWLWDTVLKPLWDGMIGFLHDKLGPAFSWISDHVSGIFDAMGGFVARVWDDMTTGIKNAVNFFIRAFNTLVDGVKAVASVIGIDVHINKMKEIGKSSTAAEPKATKAPAGHASGGMIAADTSRGGIYDRPRAVIGEGDPRYPEWVIPTDPKYRNRADMLWKQVGQRIGNVPKYSIGGWIGDRATSVGHGIKAVAGGVGDFVSDSLGTLRKGAVTAAFAPFLLAANKIIAMIPIPFVKGAANKIKNDIYNWAKGQDDKIKKPDKMAMGGVIPSLAAALGYGSLPGNLTTTLGRASAGFAANGTYGNMALNLRAGQAGMDIGTPSGANVSASASAGGGVVLNLTTPQNTTKTLHFHGNLSFPNITNKDDAEAFIRNLESLAVD